MKTFAKKGLLLINLGTPKAPTVPAVRSYLREFLMDPYVIDIPYVLRVLLVNGIIAPFRAKNSAHAYSSIWTQEGSPLMVNSSRVAIKVQNLLGDEWVVKLAMRYGEPVIADAVQELAQNPEVDQVYVLPMYPQYALSSSETALEQVRTAVRSCKTTKPISFVTDFFDNADYIDELARKMQDVQKTKTVDHWLFSFHGLPKRHLLKAVPQSKTCCQKEDCCAQVTDDNALCYRAQSFQTAHKVAQAMNLKPNEYTVSFQSRLGRAEWVKPYTDFVLQDFPKNGVKRLAIVSPSFLVDCLETLEEIQIRYRDLFLQAGGEEFTYVACLNDDDSWMKSLASYPQNKTLSWRNI